MAVDKREILQGTSEMTLLKDIIPQQKISVLNPGEAVRVHIGEDWSRKEKVVENCIDAISYVLETDKRTLIWRSHRHLLPAKEHFDCSPPDGVTF